MSGGERRQKRGAAQAPRRGEIIGLTVSRNDLDARSAMHFGKAKWLLIYQNDETYQFVRNRWLVGRAVVYQFVQAGCTDVVFANIGWGALRNLRAAGIRAWFAARDVPAREVVRLLRRGELAEAVQAEGHGCSRHRRGSRVEDPH